MLLHSRSGLFFSARSRGLRIRAGSGPKLYIMNIITRAAMLSILTTVKK